MLLLWLLIGWHAVIRAVIGHKPVENVLFADFNNVTPF
jgi:hypothetical protein